VCLICWLHNSSLRRASSFIRGCGASRSLDLRSRIPNLYLRRTACALERQQLGEALPAAESVVHDAQQAVCSLLCVVCAAGPARSFSSLRAACAAATGSDDWLALQLASQCACGCSARPQPHARNTTPTVCIARCSHLALLLGDCLLGPSTIECYTWRVDRRSSADSAPSGTGHFTTCGVFVIK